MLNYCFHDLFGFLPYSHQCIDWANIFAIIVSGLIGAFAAIYVGNKNNDEQRKINEQNLIIQKEMWSKEAYIKYEAEIITECKKVYDEVYQYIWQFEKRYLSTLAFLFSEDNIKTNFENNNCYEYYYKQFKKLYTIYKLNKQIFAKYSLDAAFEGLNFYIYLLSLTKPINDITYSLCERVIKNLNTGIDMPAYRADFWYMFPYITNHILNGGGLILNLHCTNCKELVTSEMIERYEDVIYFYSQKIQEMDTIFNKIMIVGTVKNNISPSYIQSYSLNYYKEYQNNQNK